MGIDRLVRPLLTGCSTNAAEILYSTASAMPTAEAIVAGAHDYVCGTGSASQRNRSRRLRCGPTRRPCGYTSWKRSRCRGSLLRGARSWCRSCKCQRVAPAAPG